FVILTVAARLPPAARVGETLDVSYTAPYVPPGALSARSALMRPAPKLVSNPGAPRSSAVALMRSTICEGVSVGFADRMSAASPVAKGAACDVPLLAPSIRIIHGAHCPVA